MDKINEKAGKPDDENSDVRRVREGFFKRARRSGMPLIYAKGQPLAKQRSQQMVATILIEFADQFNKDLMKFQLEHNVKILAKMVGNYDECAIDLNSHAMQWKLFSDDGSKTRNIISQFERCVAFERAGRRAAPPLAASRRAARAPLRTTAPHDRRSTPPAVQPHNSGFRGRAERGRRR